MQWRADCLAGNVEYTTGLCFLLGNTNLTCAAGWREVVIALK